MPHSSVTSDNATTTDLYESTSVTAVLNILTAYKESLLQLGPLATQRVLDNTAIDRVQALYLTMHAPIKDAPFIYKALEHLRNNPDQMTLPSNVLYAQLSDIDKEIEQLFNGLNEQVRKVIVKPNSKSPDSSAIIASCHFGYAETQHVRAHQEDALMFERLDNMNLSAQEIGHRLWTTYQILDTPQLSEGTTAVTVVYDGQGTLITALLADAASFVVAYDQQGHVFNVLRLNEITHKPADPLEHQRIKEAGGIVFTLGVPRVNGALAISRAIGDASFKEFGVCSEAHINITDLAQVITQWNIDLASLGSIQVIVVCDGFTDGAAQQDKPGHEQFLLDLLKELTQPGQLSEEELALALIDSAKQHDSQDNITIAIKGINQNSEPFMLGVYDGHGGSAASCYVADNIGAIFKAQCALPQEQYAAQELSVTQKYDIYLRDNDRAECYTPHNSNTIRQQLKTDASGAATIYQEPQALLTRQETNLKRRQAAQSLKNINTILEQLSKEKNRRKELCAPVRTNRDIVFLLMDLRIAKRDYIHNVNNPDCLLIEANRLWINACMKAIETAQMQLSDDDVPGQKYLTQVLTQLINTVPTTNTLEGSRFMLFKPEPPALNGAIAITEGQPLVASVST